MLQRRNGHTLGWVLGVVCMVAAGCSSAGLKIPVGSEGGPCTSGGGCDPGLSCLSKVCVNAGAITSTNTATQTGTDTVKVADASPSADGKDGGTADAPTVDRQTDATCPVIAIPPVSTAGCGSTFAAFAIQVTSAAPRNNIEECKISITDENGEAVLSSYVLPTVVGQDSGGSPFVRQGCAGGLTPANVGTFYYITSRASGSLRFQVDALDASGVVVQTGSTSLTTARPFPPEMVVYVPMSVVASADASVSSTGGNGATGGTMGAGGSSGGTGGTTPTGGTTGGGAFNPLCSTLLTAASVAPTKNGICVDTDPQLCYKTCGPNSIGFKSETCTAGVYVEQSSCSFPTGVDYSCYKIPTTIDATCPTLVPQASTVCTVAACVPCNVNGGYLDSSGAAKTGYCVCPAPSATTGISKWSCATSTTWPCPNGQGC